ncbi:hypothetical protein PAXRUDRAFT_828567 [Paxillus rubicundulus Ve08.2h10]|uniref:Cytochrome P450 n=1 Tax=Paxillus rubicundulus Ve08.2h10 TaxID=930991 RepID=A0A0D0DPF8_9AGAM|nr:hypothetical protein PAXRUDRAFT_828567 [Paxillus rubicundulus Ve08.2h10]
MQLPPGIKFIIANLPSMVLPPVLTLCGIRIWGSLFDSSPPYWSQISLYILSFPLALVSSVLYADLRDRRQAALNGAVLAPRVPSSWPGGLDLLISNIRNFRGGHIGDVLAQQCNDHGNTINIRIFYDDRIFTTEPEYIKAILATQFASFEKGPVFWDQANSLLGTGVFNSDGDTWKFHRAMTRPFFSKDRIRDFDIFEKHAEDAIGQMQARLREGYPVDFQDMVFRFTLDSATDFLFGKDVSSLSAGLVYPPNSPLAENVTFQNHPANVFARAFLEAQLATSYRGRFGRQWRLVEFWRDRAKKHMDICYKFIDPILKEALAKKKALKEAGLIPDQKQKDGEVPEEHTLLDHLVNYTEDPIVIRDEILNIMIAGRDTTAGTLTFVIYMLSQHPDVLRRLREEILSMVGSSRRPTLEDMREMKYLRAVINETLRLYPAVPFNVRTSTVPTVWPGIRGGKPIYIPANTRAAYSVFLMHRRKDLWGPDAEEFDPARFLDERVHKYLIPNPFIFAPFNAGPRICLGQQFAYNEVSYFIIRLLQTSCSVSLAEDVQTLPPADWAKASGRKAIEKVIVRGHLTMYAHEGVWVRMDEANHT